MCARRKNFNYLWSCHQEVIHRPRKREEKGMTLTQDMLINNSDNRTTEV